jgi:hypothetical protein
MGLALSLLRIRYGYRNGLNAIYKVLRYFQWVLQGVGEAGKRHNNKSGTQEGMALSSGISKEQDFLGRLQDEPRLFKAA